MAGHSQFANIKHRKEAQDAKRAKLFTKLTNKISVAVKSGGADKDKNSKLQIAIANAKANNVPKDRIERAILNASNLKENINKDYIRYNARFENGALLIIEAETENKNRTISEVRTIITKNKGKILETGSVEYEFDHVGLISYKAENINFDDFFLKVSEFNPINISEKDGYFIIETDPLELHKISIQLIDIKELGEIQEVKIIWKPKNTIQLDEEELNKMEDVINQIEELDDVEDIFFNY